MNSALLWNAAENKRKIPKIQSEFLAFKFRRHRSCKASRSVLLFPSDGTAPGASMNWLIVHSAKIRLNSAWAQLKLSSKISARIYMDLCIIPSP